MRDFPAKTSTSTSSQQDVLDIVTEPSDSPMTLTVSVHGQDYRINMLKDHTDHEPDTQDIQDIQPEGRVESESEPSIQQKHIQVTEMISNTMVKKASQSPKT